MPNNSRFRFSHEVQTSTISFAALQEFCLAENLNLVGVARIDATEQSRQNFLRWQQDFSADLHYMQRDIDSYFEPERLLANCKSVLVVGAFYESLATPVRPPGYGRIARYAWGRDYHRALKKSVQQVALNLADQFKGLEYRIFTDAVPLLERAFAKSAGIGFVGKNSMLIKPKQGSFFLLAEMLVNLEVEANKIEQKEFNCGSCSRCMTQCPTNAIVEPYVVDARKCISYLTIEKRGLLTHTERIALGEWLFGCDICQEVCPFNHRAQHYQTPEVFPAFRKECGAGPFLNLSDILDIEDQVQFTKRFAGTPLMRSKRQGLVRNAICVAHNILAFDLFDKLEQLAVADADPIIRAHACWAVIEMARKSGDISGVRIQKIVNAAREDPNLVVQQELSLVPGN